MRRTILLFVVLISVFIFSVNSVSACGLHRKDKTDVNTESAENKSTT